MSTNHAGYSEKRPSKKARVVLRPDGDVHIAFDSSTSIRATARAVLELFQNPMYFMEEGCLRYVETTAELCRNGQKIVPLDDVLGLDLAYMTADRQIVCDFTELFGGLFSSIGTSNMDKPLNMKDMICVAAGQSLSDEKAFLLRYYLEIGSFFAEKEAPIIERHIKLRDDVMLAIMKIAVRSFASSAPQRTPKPVAISDYLAKINVPPAPMNEEDANSYMVGTTEYGKMIGVTAQQVRNMIKEELLPARKDSKGNYIVDKRAIPKDWKKRKHKQAKLDNSMGSYESVQKLIRENKYFTAAVAPYISSMTEVHLFAQSHREVLWDGRPALIIDIHPNYATKDGVTNRQRIRDGKAPISPDSPDEEPFHLHHMSKRADAPIAIITSEDHRKHSRFLHQAPDDPEMDRREFQMQRISFWATYLRKYDEGGYDAIAYLNKPIDTNLKNR